MLAAGSACTIATLWSVDDMAAALLMTRLYEEMRDRRLRPPEALCRAQNWLRELTEASEREFLRAHPALDREFRRRVACGQRPGRRSEGSVRELEGRRKWYAHPDYWAPFVAIGA
jgi:CHAT domain-containing protein